MKLLSIIVADEGRKLKYQIQGIIKSGVCARILVSNYVHSYRASDGKGLTKTQHKLIQIQFEDSSKLTIMLDKLIPGRRSDHRICDITTIE